MPTRRSSLADRQRQMRERHAPERAEADLRNDGVVFLEPHFAPKELGRRWGGLSETTIRRPLKDAPRFRSANVSTSRRECRVGLGRRSRAAR